MSAEPLDIDEFVKDRNAALLSLDLATINAYLVKYGSRPMPDTEIAWRGIHKARTAITAFPEPERQKSRDWLAEHGSEAWG